MHQSMAPDIRTCATQIVEELLERNFGELELKSDSNYQNVWDADAASLNSAPAGGGESVIQVILEVPAGHVSSSCAGS